ncbi:MAG: hypothetical protein WC184_12780 [Acidimicrobiia bacterium]
MNKTRKWDRKTWLVIAVTATAFIALIATVLLPTITKYQTAKNEHSDAVADNDVAMRNLENLGTNSEESPLMQQGLLADSKIWSPQTDQTDQEAATLYNLDLINIIDTATRNTGLSADDVQLGRHVQTSIETLWVRSLTLNADAGADTATRFIEQLQSLGQFVTVTQFEMSYSDTPKFTLVAQLWFSTKPGINRSGDTTTGDVSEPENNNSQIIENSDPENEPVDVLPNDVPIAPENVLRRGTEMLDNLDNGDNPENQF